MVLGYCCLFVLKTLSGHLGRLLISMQVDANEQATGDPDAAADWNLLILIGCNGHMTTGLLGT